MSLPSLVRSLADNKQLLGMRYAEWCTAAPSLEADIAAAAMGLDDIGHSRVLYGCLSELGGGEGGDVYTNVPYLDQPWTDWGQFVAANAVLDSAFTLMIEALAAGSVELLRTRLRKILQEERYHFLHGHSWIKEVDATSAVERAWREAVQWFGPEGADVDQLHRTAQLGSGVTELRQRLGERLNVQVPQPVVDFAGWDAVRRRGSPGGIDEGTLEMLRGLNERRYMPNNQPGA